MRGLTHKTLDFHGECFSFDDVPMELEPLQKPHPPVWYGVHSAVSAERAARQGLNIVSLDPADKTRAFTDRFREVWREAQAKNRIAPLVGLGRFIFVAETDEEALTIGRRAYPDLASELQLSFPPPRRQRPGASTAGGVGRDSSKSARVSRAVR